MKSLYTVFFIALAILCPIKTIVLAKHDPKTTHKTYIIHVDKSTMPTPFQSHIHWYGSILTSVSKSARMLYFYNEVIHGFSASLKPQDVISLKMQPGVLSVYEEKNYKLYTTRTRIFLGLEEARKSGVLPPLSEERDIVIGLLDSGIWPESESFDDTGLGPVRSNWKGECEEGTNFTSSSCNRKLVGARYFCRAYEEKYGPIDEKKEYRSPRDSIGHGTHTSSTAAGSRVPNASLFGYAAGTATGMAGNARLAMYKVGWKKGIQGSDVLAAMDKALSDGVDVISTSFGLLNQPGHVGYDTDALAVASFTAMAKGVLVSCAVGNDGPRQGSLVNGAPWVTSVGAGTLDRTFPAVVTLGNGEKYFGASLHRGKRLYNYSTIVYDKNCISGTLDPSHISGKIVICDGGLIGDSMKGLRVRQAGGIGVVVTNAESSGDELVVGADLLPTIIVNSKAGKAIKAYARLGGNQKAKLSWGHTQLDVQPSPKVASFSSRGPSTLTPEILKPDILAPGFNILAGWTGNSGPSFLKEDPRRVEFNIISGTSMASPLVSGVAALIKAAHPDWSPAVIRSAMMTTAVVTTKNGEPIIDDASRQAANSYDYGAGHVNPVAAFNPGLVYDASVEDYLDFLCALNYTPEQIRIVAKQSYICDVAMNYSLGDLNYPSFAIIVKTSTGSSGSPFTVKYTRTLTNVGDPGTYKANLTLETPEIKIEIKPKSLTFRKPYEKKSYTVTFTALSKPDFPFKYARLVWSDDKHFVASPIAFNWN